MDREAFYQELALILQRNRSQIDNSVVLKDCGWDSLAEVSILIVMDQCAKRKVLPADISRCRTVGDLVHLAGIE